MNPKDNEWELYATPFFYGFLIDLVEQVERYKKHNPDGFHKHPDTKLLKAIKKVIIEVVPENPNDKDFWLGKTLGDKYKNWRRVKKQLPPRRRLFFTFSSTEKKIVYAYFSVNLRKADDKNDPYLIFKKMLDRGDISPDYNGVMEDATKIPPMKPEPPEQE